MSIRKPQGMGEKGLSFRSPEKGIRKGTTLRRSNPSDVQSDGFRTGVAAEVYRVEAIRNPSVVASKPSELAGEDGMNTGMNIFKSPGAARFHKGT